MIRNRNVDGEEDITENSEVESLSVKLVELLNEYSRTQTKYIKDDVGMPDEIKNDIIKCDLSQQKT